MKSAKRLRITNSPGLMSMSTESGPDERSLCTPHGRRVPREEEAEEVEVTVLPYLESESERREATVAKAYPLFKQ